MPRETLSSTPTAAGPESMALKPPLQRALASLSVDLDTELMRYRQSRHGETVSPTPKALSFRKRRKPIDLIRVEGKSEVKPLAPTPVPTVPSAAKKPVPPPPPPNPRLLNPHLAPDDRTAQLSAALAPIRPTPVPPADDGVLTPYNTVPDDFLESTEALLGTASEDYDDLHDPRDTEYEPSLWSSLATPLGMGALLLLLVGSAGFGYLLTNPSAISHLLNLPAIQALRGKTPETIAGAGPNGGAFKPGLEGLGPDLSQREFVDLNLGSLSTLPSEQAGLPPTVASTPTVTMPPVAVQPGTPTVTPTTLSSSQPTSSRPTVVVPSQTVAVVPRPTAPSRPPVTVPTTVRPTMQPPARPVAPAPTRPVATAPAPTRPAASTQAAPPPLSAAAPSPAANPNYYVVTDFTGDQSLNAARSAVGDAYVRNFSSGARIQMGAFSDKSSAESLVQNLQQQGISAQVYTP